jgi:nicotinate phosphoribosyltransferase
MDMHYHNLSEGILFTDMYQLTMAQLYYRIGMHERQVQFDHFFRDYPDYGSHKAGFCINAGLEWLIDWMQTVRFREEDVEYLRGLKSGVGGRLFDDDFLHWLGDNGDFRAINMQAIPEGRVIHPNVPLTIVRGPLLMAQILETALLNKLNYSILIATKAALIREVGRCQILMEFGLRRAHDKGGNAGARAALIGGADYTSNVGISVMMDVPPKGTHAHSMVQLFLSLGMSELDAFRAYADVYPDDCLLLVDTIDTLESGIPNAITVFNELKQKGHQPHGIRLDSGDLAYLSIQAARMLNAAGFPDVFIVLSNNLDELIIWQIVTQIRDEAPRYGLDADHLIKRLVYGVGTRLITSHGDSALGGVYKLVAVEEDGEWLPAIKISDSPSKTPNPGDKKVWRLYDARGKATADLVTEASEDPRQMERIYLHHPSDHTKFRSIARSELSTIEPLLQDIFVDGKLVMNSPTLEEMRALRKFDVDRLDPGVRRIMYPHIYHVSLSQTLWDLKQKLILETLENH